VDRYSFIERSLRQIYGKQPTDDSDIDYDLVNSWLNDAISIAAKKNYTDNFTLEGIGFVNNSFYTKFKALPIISDERFLWRITLPEIPIGIGANEGIATVVFKDSKSTLSYPGIPLSENQVGYARSQRTIPNKILIYPEGIYCYAITTILMTSYTANVTMISGGDSTTLDSILNVPPDYYPVMVDYIKQQLSFERAAKQDTSNDGSDQP
jgi:hypothetical protein